MKFSTSKFAFICASIGTIFFVVTNAVARITLFDQIFTPIDRSRETLPQLYFLNYSIIGVLLVFAIVFSLAWAFAKVYNKFTLAKK